MSPLLPKWLKSLLQSSLPAVEGQTLTDADVLEHTGTCGGALGWGGRDHPPHFPPPC